MNTKNSKLMLMAIPVIVGLLFAAIPSAMASPGIGSTKVPAIPVVGGTALLGPQGVTGGTVFDNTIVRVYDPMLTSVGNVATLINGEGVSGAGKCSFNDHPEATGRFWDLYSTTGPARALLDVGTSGDGLVRFGDGTPAETAFTAVVLDGSTPAPLFWRQDTGEGTQADGTDAIDIFASATAVPTRQWVVAVCGDENDGSGTITGSGSVARFFTQKPVAGTIIPIDMTSMVLAGLMTQQTGLLTGLVVVAGLAFTALRFLAKKPKLD